MSTTPALPRITVVIPCYNQAHYLVESIQCVLDQTLKEFEIIVVDDGSTDDTTQVVARFGGVVRCVRQENKGLAAARNAGIQAARGEFVGFLDADDLWLPNFLQVLTPILEHEQYLGAVYCGSQFIDSRGYPLPQTITRTYPADQLHNVLTGGDFFPAHSVLVRRSVFQEAGLFDESLNASEDWDLWLRISARYRFAGVPNILALYRMHGNNMSRDLERMLESQRQVARKHFGAEIGAPAGWPIERQRAYAGIYLWHAIAHYQRGEQAIAAEYFRRTIVTCPSVARSLDMFYALVCAEQPPGHTGDLGSLDLKRNAERALNLLEVIFACQGIPIGLESNRHVAYGMLYFALGILAYGQRNLGHARSYLIRAVLWDPSLLASWQWSSTFAKALVGRRVLFTLLGWKRAKAISI